MEAIVIDAVRTPLGCGRPEGALAGISTWRLLAELFGALLNRNNVVRSWVDSILLATPTESAGARSTGRRAWRAVGSAGHEPRIETTDVAGRPSRASSGQDLIHRAARSMFAGECQLAIVAGAESTLADRTPESAAGLAAERLAARWGLDRDQLDEYAARSRRNAAEVAAMGEFRAEIVPIPGPGDETGSVIAEDETVGAGPPRLDRAEPLFRDERLAARYPEIGWHITAENSSDAADGAAAVLIATERFAAECGLRGRARFVVLADWTSDDAAAVDGLGHATNAVLARSRLDIDAMDHYEVSETFAPIALAWQRQFGADLDRFNPRGGAIGLGRPAGAAGIRSMTTMLRALEDTGGSLGLQVMDGVGGRFHAMVIERG